MTVRELTQEPLDVSPVDRECTLAHLLEVERTFLLGHPETQVSTRTARRYHTLIARRRRGEPLPYVLGTWPFSNLNFIVNRHVLIPRPETEWLVERGLKLLRENDDISTVVDIGTGSGCVIVSLLKNLSATRRIGMTAYATDISKAALAVATRNARRHKVQSIHWRVGDLLEPVDTVLTRASSRVLLLANLPYLTTTDYQESALSVRQFEPKCALHAGTDGLRYYRKLLTTLARYPATFFCLWEVDPCHAATLCELVRRRYPGVRPEIRKDLGGHARYLTFTAHKNVARRMRRAKASRS